MSTTEVRWGILGAGHVAREFGLSIGRTSGNVVARVASRSRARAVEISSEIGGIPSESYSDLIHSGDVDVVYIATTHPYHHEQALAVIRAGIPVVVEKPLALSAAQAREIADEARRRGVFAMEAMWLKTDPLIIEAATMIRDGAIGPLVGLSSRLALGIPYDPSHRLFDRDNGGGAIMDLGVYHVALAQVFLGDPLSLSATGTMLPSGVDATTAMQLTYSDGVSAQLWCSLVGRAEFATTIFGERGYIRFDGPASSPRGFEVRTDDHHTRRSRLRDVGFGHEIQEVARCLREGLIESPLVPLPATVRAHDTLDELRRLVGVHYPQEGQMG